MTARVVFQLSVAVCVGFLTAWSPYAIVSMWAAFGDATAVPPMAFATAAIFAKSSTLYNPIIYLVFKPNFRKSLCVDVARCRRTLCGRLCRPGPAQKAAGTDECNSTRLSNGLQDNHGTCRRCPAAAEAGGTPRRAAGEAVGGQPSDELQSDFL